MFSDGRSLSPDQDRNARWKMGAKKGESPSYNYIYTPISSMKCIQYLFSINLIIVNYNQT